MTDLIPLRHHSPPVQERVTLIWRGGCVSAQYLLCGGVGDMMNWWAGVADPSCPQVLLQGMFAALVGAEDARQSKDEGRSRTQS